MATSGMTTLAGLADQLAKSEIFADLSMDDLLSIAEISREVTYSEGQRVLEEGQTADNLFVVTRGKLALEKSIHLGRQSTPRNATIGYLTPGRVAGFSTLSKPHIYSTSAICLEPTRCIAVEGNALRSYLEAHPAAGYKVMSTLAVIIGDRYRHAINTLTYFLSIVSHELRSPLAAIENYLQTMLGGYTGELTPKQERMMTRSVLRLRDLRSLISDVVDLARMRPEQIQADFEWFDLGEVGNESIEDVQISAAEKNIRLKIEPPPEFKPIVGSRRRMRQVFTNLLNNAIRYSPPDTVVTFRAHYEPDEVIIEVEDQGQGIPLEDLPHIFKEFYRASNVGEVAGMGLGLSIAQMIVDAHHGEISVTNLTEAEGRPGTQFAVRIPLNLMTPKMQREQWVAEGVS